MIDHPIIHQKTHAPLSHSLSLICILMLLSLFQWSCDKLAEELTGGSQRSTCEAYCEWAVACHSAEREVDEAQLLEQCHTQTKESNEDCAALEDEGLDPVRNDLYASCVSAIDAERTAGECGPFTGNLLEINTSTPPTDCLTASTSEVDVFNTARVATTEENDVLCQRMSQTLCERSVECLISNFSLTEDILSAIHVEPIEECVAQLADNVTSSCIEDQLYRVTDEEGMSNLPEEAGANFSLNPSRAAARTCLNALATLSCDDFVGGMLPPVCAGAFFDPTTVLGGLESFVCGLGRPELSMVCGG